MGIAGYCHHRHGHDLVQRLITPQIDPGRQYPAHGQVQLRQQVTEADDALHIPFVIHHRQRLHVMMPKHANGLAHRGIRSDSADIPGHDLLGADITHLAPQGRAFGIPDDLLQIMAGDIHEGAELVQCPVQILFSKTHPLLREDIPGVVQIGAWCLLRVSHPGQIVVQGRAEQQTTGVEQHR